MREGRSWWALAAPLVVASVVVGSGDVSAWEHNAVLWNEATSPIPVQLHNAGVDELSVEELEVIVQQAFEVWNAVPCSYMKLGYEGLTEHTVMVDEEQTLQWISDPDAWVYGEMAAGANMAFTYDPPETPEHEDPKVDIAFNGVNFMWRPGGAGPRDVTILDPQAVLTHELGHFLGLAHTRESNAATMAPAYVPDTRQTSLSFDDKAGMCFKYWVEASECEDDSDCAEGSTCRALESPAGDCTFVRLCAEHHGLWGDPCAGDDLNCRDICLFTRNDLSEGACSTRCEDDLDCPCGWSCRNIQSPDNPLLVCREAPAEGDVNCPDEPVEPDDRCGVDAGPDVVEDAGPDADAGGGEDSGEDSGEDAAPDAPEDEEGEAATPMPKAKDEGCGCVQASPGRGAAWLVVVVMLGAVVALRAAARRR